MNEKVTIWLPDAKKTTSCGESMAKTFYDVPLDICLRGELGAGKTTFLQGFARALGITEPITSPTYALEQLYETAKGMSLIHIDLYRFLDNPTSTLVHEIGLDEWMDRDDALIAIEWPLPEVAGLFSGFKTIRFRYVNDTVREVFIDE